MKFSSISITAGAAVAALTFSAAAAAANTIYSDSFDRGTSANPVMLDGSTPTVAPAQTTWTADITGTGPTLDTNGSAAVFGGTPVAGDGVFAYLPVTSSMLSSNSELTYSVTLDPTNDNSNWLAMGFGDLNFPGEYAASRNLILGVIYKGSGLPQSGVNGNPTSNYGTNFTSGTQGTAGVPDTFTVTLNTTSGAYTISDSLALISGVSGTLTSTDLAAVSNVFIGSYSDVLGTATNLSLDGPAVATPEPTTLGLLGIGGLGLLLARRRRA